MAHHVEMEVWVKGYERSDRRSYCESVNTNQKKLKNVMFAGNMYRQKLLEHKVYVILQYGNKYIWQAWTEIHSNAHSVMKGGTAIILRMLHP